MSEYDTGLTPADELRMLKERARLMGITFSGNIGVDKLREKIDARLSGEDSNDADEDDTNVMSGSAPAPRPMTKAEREQKIRDDLYREKMKLVRCRIYNLNPAKRDLQGEIITVANKFLGTVRKFIPFGEATDQGYHIPQCIYDELKSRQFQQIRTKTVKGQIQVIPRIVPEYSVEVLPPLTTEELKDLAIKQAAAERFDADA